jgi:hypothetical protein
MNEQWKRLIEAERRLARLESTLQRTNTRIVSVNGAVRNDATDVRNPFGSGGGGGGGATPRFSTEFEMWVEWDAVPTLKTAASSNVPADGPALAETVSQLETGFLLNSTVGNSTNSYWMYDTTSSRLAVYFQVSCSYVINHSGNTNNANCNFTFAWYEDDTFRADAYTDGPTFGQGAIVAQTFTGSLTRIEMQYPRRNAGGAIISTATVTARRTLASTSVFSYGPKYGENGTWSFAMECPATTYHNAGSGTIYLRWGTATESIVAGGTSGSLPSDSYDGGSADSLPADIIDGGTF